MKTIKLYIALFLSFSGYMLIYAQETEQKLSEAKSSYKAGKLEESRFALEEALRQVHVLIGQEILKVLPEEMKTLQVSTEEDEVTGMGSGNIGIFVNRYYKEESKEKKASISIITDSPLLAGINTILSMPLVVSGDPNQKRIKVDGYKALLQKNESENGSISYNVQIPFNNSLLTFSCEGFSDENDVVTMANTIPVSKIVNISK